MTTAAHPDDRNHVHGKGVQEGLAPLARDLRRAIPDVYKAFSELHGAALAPGALDAKTKELIALALGVASQCDGCIASHAKGAARHGATEAEVAETLGVVILMTGGPGTVYGPRALASFRSFVAATQPPNPV